MHSADKSNNYTPPKLPPIKHQFFRKIIPRDNNKKVLVPEVVDETPEVLYKRGSSSYYLQELLNYSRRFARKDIKGPEQEIPIIDNLMLEFGDPNSLIQVFKPLEDLVCTSVPEGFNHEVDFLSRLLIIPKGVIADVRFEVKEGFKDFEDLRSQLTNIKGDLYPVIVEHDASCSNRRIVKRLSELETNLGDIALAFMVHDDCSFNVRFNLDLISTPPVIHDILAYDKFKSVLERDLLITAYSLFSNLGYIGGGFKKLKFEDGLLVDKKYSFSLSPTGDDGNQLIVYRPFIGFLDDGAFTYRSVISESLGDNFFNRLSENYSMSLRYVTPPIVAESAVFIDPHAPSNFVLNGLMVAKHYLLRKLSGLSKCNKMKIDIDLPK